jgi:hypothetical protein
MTAGDEAAALGEIRVPAIRPTTLNEQYSNQCPCFMDGRDSRHLVRLDDQRQGAEIAVSARL